MKVGDLVRHINLDEIFVVVVNPARECHKLLGDTIRVSVTDHRGTRRIDVGFLEVISASR